MQLRISDAWPGAQSNEPGATPIRVSTLTKNINKINNTKKSNSTINANNSNEAEAIKAELSKAIKAKQSLASTCT